MTSGPNAIVVGAGINGLTAGIVLAAHGVSTTILEAEDLPGGNARTMELTLPGFLNDHCSAVHPMGILSPILSVLDLEQHGLEWCFPKFSAAHPLDSEPAVLLRRSVEETAETTGRDTRNYQRLMAPLHRHFRSILHDVLTPPGLSKSFLPLAKFGSKGIQPCTRFAKRVFEDERAKALFAGCAAHSILPLSKFGTAAVGLIFLLAGHAVDWPMAGGGSRSITDALVSKFRALGGRLEFGVPVLSHTQLPESDVVLFDLSPTQVARICDSELPPRFQSALHKYVYGPAVFKLDYALSCPIPWADPECAGASTVHVGGTLDEIASSEKAAWEGKFHDRPFVMVCQQSHFDPDRAPEGKHTGYAYCHVPNGSDRDYTDAIESQIERFAPGFRDCILHRSNLSPSDLQADNRSNEGGVITGGATTLKQIVFRPTARIDSYSTPNPRFFLCSHSTPPGGGVHGMCGRNAALSALKRLKIPYDQSLLS